MVADGKFVPTKAIWERSICSEAWGHQVDGEFHIEVMSEGDDDGIEEIVLESPESESSDSSDEDCLFDFVIVEKDPVFSTWFSRDF